MVLFKECFPMFIHIYIKKRNGDKNYKLVICSYLKPACCLIGCWQIVMQPIKTTWEAGRMGRNGHESINLYY